MKDSCPSDSHTFHPRELLFEVPRDRGHTFQTGSMVSNGDELRIPNRVGCLLVAKALLCSHGPQATRCCCPTPCVTDHSSIRSWRVGPWSPGSASPPVDALVVHEPDGCIDVPQSWRGLTVFLPHARQVRSTVQPMLRSRYSTKMQEMKKITWDVT
jgi:hypothetical protein